MKQNPETIIQNAVKQYLQMRGWFVIRNQQGLGSHRGMPDLTACKNCMVVFIEVKTPKGYLSEYQKKFQNDLVSHGCIFEVARSVDDAERIDRAYGGGGQSLVSLLAEPETEKPKPRRFKYPR